MELKLWREPFTINMAKQACRHNNRDKYSVAILASGGLLDTLAAIRAGLSPIWGSEIYRLSTTENVGRFDWYQMSWRCICY